jgi:hypothetical protein
VRRLIALLSLGFGAAAPAMRERGAAAAGDIQVAVATDVASVHAGQQLRIMITVLNQSTSLRTVEFSSGCQTDYEFLDSRGGVVARSQRMCAQAKTQRTLRGGEEFTEVHTWARQSSEPNQLKPGAYQLRGVLLAIGDTVRSTPIPVDLP